MVLCDDVHRDPSTGKHTILGTFSTLAAQEYPAQLQICVYYAITDGLGSTDIRLRLVDARSIVGDEEEVVFEVETEMDFEDPLVVIEAAVGIRTPVPKAGQYHCELWAGDELLMSRRLLAIGPDDGGTEHEQHD